MKYLITLILISFSLQGMTMDYSAKIKKLDPLQYRVTQKQGTEPPFNNKYWDNKAEGIYVDIVSNDPLFSSTHKYKSGTGWPSFYETINPQAIENKEDNKLFMRRVELVGKKANTHLGHVFEDGPKPTGLRYCINSASLRFIPKDQLEKEGFGEYLKLFKKEQSVEVATLGGGCFWGVQELLRKQKGVLKTTVGYMGGHSKNPGYYNVVEGDTGHAEVVQIEFDPNIISYEKLLSFFWRLHNPTQLNRQGPDVGTQYRSVIFYHNDAQREAAINSKLAFDKKKIFDKKAVTEIASANTFYKGEEYHQKYYQKNPGRVCHRMREE